MQEKDYRKEKDSYFDKKKIVLMLYCVEFIVS